MGGGLEVMQKTYLSIPMVFNFNKEDIDDHFVIYSFIFQKILGGSILLGARLILGNLTIDFSQLH